MNIVQRLPRGGNTTWEELVRGNYAQRIQHFIIDNLDMCLQGMARTNVHTVTLTNNAPAPPEYVQ